MVTFGQADKAIARMSKALNEKFELIPKQLEQLNTIYSGGNVVTRYRVVAGIAEIECKDAMSFLEKVLRKDDSAVVRHEAAFAIGIMGNFTNQEILMYALRKDPASIVRHEAAIALGTIGDKECMDALEEASKEKEALVSVSARYALELINNRKDSA